jgi:hypothetical protein
VKRFVLRRCPVEGAGAAGWRTGEGVAGTPVAELGLKSLRAMVGLAEFSCEKELLQHSERLVK